MLPLPPRSTLFPYTTLFRSQFLRDYNRKYRVTILLTSHYMADIKELCERVIVIHKGKKIYDGALDRLESRDRKSTRLNSSHTVISYAVFCLKKKNTETKDKL